MTNPDSSRDRWELFEMAGISPASVKRDGCFINLRIYWDCFVDTGAGCNSPRIEAKRLDVGEC